MEKEREGEREKHSLFYGDLRTRMDCNILKGFNCGFAFFHVFKLYQDS